MCYVTATELKKNLSHYLERSLNEDVYVTKNNKIISVITNPNMKSYFLFKQAVEEMDIHDNGISDDQIIYEEIMKR